VRAIGAFGILLVHVGLISGYSPTPWTRFGAYFARAEVGVTVFFLISGFVIWRPFVAAAFADRPAPAVGQFLARRFVRVVPLYWFVLTVVLFVQHRSPVHGLGDVVTFYGFLQIYRPGYEIEGVQQAWSLCTIVSFYLAAPALARLMRPGHRRLPAAGGARLAFELGVLAAIFAGAYGYRWLVVSDYALNPLSADGRILWLPTSADVFAVGMALAAVHAWGEERGGFGSRLAGALGRVPGEVWWLAGAACYWVVCTRVGLPRTVGAVGTRQWMLREVLYTATAAFLLLPALFGPPRRGPVRRFLASGPMVFLGVLSYGVFLWHEYVLDEYRRVREILPFEGWFWGMLAVTVVGSVALATVTLYTVERPTAAWAQRLPWLRKPHATRPG